MKYERLFFLLIALILGVVFVVVLRRPELIGAIPSATAFMAGTALGLMVGVSASLMQVLRTHI